MKSSRLVMTIVLLVGSITVSATGLTPQARGANTGIAVNAFDIHLFAPSTATPGQTIGIELWTIFANATDNTIDLAYNHTAVGVANTTVSFTVKTNVGSVPAHVHTPGGVFVTLTPFKQWVHPGAWNTSYTVPSQTGLYGVHVYANFTIIPARGASSSYITQAEATFTVQNAAATPSDVSALATQNMSYALLGLVAVAIVLDLAILFWKKSPAKTA
jgi:hypothetical protein